jgi:hypothetical protein
VVVPAPELLSINVAVGDKIGMIGAFRKGNILPVTSDGTLTTTSAPTLRERRRDVSHKHFTQLRR